MVIEVLSVSVQYKEFRNELANLRICSPIHDGEKSLMEN